MAIIETKYSIGDTVWSAGTTTTAKQHPCPDCLGSRKWEARSPAGAVFAVNCPRCAGEYQSSRALNLRYSVWVGTAEKLTIGQVRPCAGDGGEHQYMCLETGIGSGTLHRESRLFVTEDEARACAEAMASVANLDAAGWVAKQYDETAKFCDYQLKDAEIEAAQAAARRALYDVGYLLDDLAEADALEAVHDRIAAWRDERAAA